MVAKIRAAPIAGTPWLDSSARVAGRAGRKRGWALSFRLAPTAAFSIIRATPAVVNGEPRSLTNTKGDAGLSRWSRAQRPQLAYEGDLVSARSRTSDARRPCRLVKEHGRVTVTVPDVWQQPAPSTDLAAKPEN
jgi:hypothetical protein